MHLDTYDQPDRKDCIRQHDCRSPHACKSISRCADTLTPNQDLIAFGYGSGIGCSGKRPTKRRPPVALRPTNTVCQGVHTDG